MTFQKAEFTKKIGVRSIFEFSFSFQQSLFHRKLDSIKFNQYQDIYIVCQQKEICFTV